MKLHLAGRHTTAELAELFNVARATVYRTVRRQEAFVAPARRTGVEVAPIGRWFPGTNG